MINLDPWCSHLYLLYFHQGITTSLTIHSDLYSYLGFLILIPDNEFTHPRFLITLQILSSSKSTHSKFTFLLWAAWTFPQFRSPVADLPGSGFSFPSNGLDYSLTMNSFSVPTESACGWSFPLFTGFDFQILCILSLFSSQLRDPWCSTRELGKSFQISLQYCHWRHATLWNLINLQVFC